MKPKIFCFINGSLTPSALIVYALAEDGCHLASHLSSTKEFAKHDIGITSDWKHGIYKEYYPDGYELEWVDDVDSHAYLKYAVAKNQSGGKDAKRT